VAELKLQLTSGVKTTQQVSLITNLLTKFTQIYKGQKMATFSTLEECERVSRLLTGLGVQYKQKIRRKKSITEPYAIVLLDDPSLLLALIQCPHCGDPLPEHNWCKHCGDVTWLDEYEDLPNKMGWPG